VRYKYGVNVGRVEKKSGAPVKWEARAPSDLETFLMDAMIQNTTVFESKRSFVIFSFSASHGLLLLRSPKGHGCATRVDVLFQDVRAMELRSWFVGVKIQESDLQSLAKCRSNPGGIMEPGNRVYSLIGDGWCGFVAGGIMAVHEDSGEYGDPSALLSKP